MNELKIGLAGWFRLDAIQVDGDGNEISRRIAADWFPNLITDAGLDMLAADPAPFLAAQVGGGSTPPSVLDTALVARVAGSATTQAGSSGAQSSPPYYGWVRRTIRFPAGAAAGNLTELGMSNTATGTLFSRALILDSNGDPTTIAIQPDEVLDVTYELRTYPPTADVSFPSVDISGTSHACIVRASRVADVNYWAGLSGTSNNFVMNNGWTAYNGSLGDITSFPAGTPASVSYVNMLISTYAAGSLYRDVTVNATLNEWNLSGGISAVLARTKLGTFQISYSPPIPKTASFVLSLPFRISWGRHTP